MRACWAATLLVLVQPSPASCATCRGTSVVSRVLALTHQHLRKSPSVRQPFAEISGSISFSPPVFPFPETVPNFVCHFKGSLHDWGEPPQMAQIIWAQISREPSRRTDSSRRNSGRRVNRSLRGEN